MSGSLSVGSILASGVMAHLRLLLEGHRGEALEPALVFPLDHEEPEHGPHEHRHEEEEGEEGKVEVLAVSVELMVHHCAPASGPLSEEDGAGCLPSFCR